MWAQRTKLALDIEAQMRRHGRRETASSASTVSVGSLPVYDDPTAEAPLTRRDARRATAEVTTAFLILACLVFAVLLVPACAGRKVHLAVFGTVGWLAPAVIAVAVAAAAPRAIDGPWLETLTWNNAVGSGFALLAAYAVVGYVASDVYAIRSPYGSAAYAPDTGLADALAMDPLPRFATFANVSVEVSGDRFRGGRDVAAYARVVAAGSHLGDRSGTQIPVWAEADQESAFANIGGGGTTSACE